MVLTEKSQGGFKFIYSKMQQIFLGIIYLSSQSAQNSEGSKDQSCRYPLLFKCSSLVYLHQVSGHPAQVLQQGHLPADRQTLLHGVAIQSEREAIQ